MDLSTYVAELRDSLAAAASLGDDTTQRSTAALAGALEPATRLALLHALSDLAAEVTHQLHSTSSPDGEQIAVDVRLEGRDVRVVATRTPATMPFGGLDDQQSPGRAGRTGSTGSAESTGSTDDVDADGHPRTFAEASGDLTRTTVRMFNQLKSQAEKAASEQGVSLNSFISRAVSDSIRGEKARRHNRSGDRRTHRDADTTISGYVQG